MTTQREFLKKPLICQDNIPLSIYTNNLIEKLPPEPSDSWLNKIKPFASKALPVFSVLALMFLTYNVGYSIIFVPENHVGYFNSTKFGNMTGTFYKPGFSISTLWQTDPFENLILVSTETRSFIYQGTPKLGVPYIHSARVSYTPTEMTLFIQKLESFKGETRLFYYIIQAVQAKIYTVLRDGTLQQTMNTTTFSVYNDCGLNITVGNIFKTYTSLLPLPTLPSEFDRKET